MTTPRVTRRLAAVDRVLQRAATRFDPVESEIGMLDRFLPEGGVCCDVGAEYGLYTLTFARRVGPGGTVLSFEPLPGPNAFVSRIAKLCGASNVEVRSEALGDEPRTGAMSLPRRRGLPVHGRAFLADDADGLGPNAEFAGERRLPVHVTTLDVVLEEAGVSRLDLIKIDVEGFEPAVLRGAQRSLRRFRPALLIEIEDRHLDKFGHDGGSVVELVREHGYQMAVAERGRWMPVDGVTERHRNYLFTPDEAGPVA